MLYTDFTTFVKGVQWSCKLFNFYFRLYNRSVYSLLSQFAGLIRSYKGIDKLIDISVHYLINLVQSEVDPVVCYSSLMEIVGPYLLGSVSGANLASSKLSLVVVSRGTLDPCC